MNNLDRRIFVREEIGSTWGPLSILAYSGSDNVMPSVGINAGTNTGNILWQFGSQNIGHAIRPLGYEWGWMD